MIFADRVKESSTTTGTGAMSLGGAETGFIPFSAVMTIGQTCYYCIYGQSSASWETGIGTFASGDTLQRTTVIQSSNSNALVNFGAETKDIFLTVDATYFTGTLSQNTTGTASNITGTLAIANGGTGATSAVLALDALGAETVFNGIENSALYSLSYSASTRILSITYSTGAAYTVGGVRYTPSAGTVTTTAHANTSGIWFFYYNSSGVLTVTSTAWNLLTNATIALVYYNATNVAAILFNELHPGNSGMGPAAHLNLHTTRGTQLVSGCVPSGFTLATGGLANISYAVSAGSIADEDLVVGVTAQAQGGANTYLIFYQTGTSASPVWNWIADAEGGIYTNGTNIYYNQLTGGSWQLTPNTSNGSYVNYWLMAIPSYNGPQLIIIMGTAEYSTLALAQAATFATEAPNIGLFTVEGVILYQMTYRRFASDGTPGNADLQSVTRVTQSIISVGGGSGSVTSVGLADATGTFSVTGSPVTSSGNLVLSAFNSQAQNAFLAAPSTGGAGTPSFRAIATADIPTLNQNTTGTAGGLSTTLAVTSGGTGTTTSTGTGSTVLSNSPTLVTPVLGTPASGTLTNCTFPTLNQSTTGTAAGLSTTLAVASGGTGVTTSTGSGSNVLNTSPSLVTPVLGTPTSGTLTNCSGLPFSGVGSGTSTGTLVVGTGGSLATSGTGTISATSTTNVAGGAAGSIPYQTTGAGVTGFVAIGSVGQMLIVSGSAPIWSNSPTLNNYSETYNASNVSGTYGIALGNGPLQKLTATAAATLNMPSPASSCTGKNFTIILAPGSYTISWGTVYWLGTSSNSTAPTISASKLNILTFFCDGTNWYGFLTGAA